jgi:hypothetical protein
MSPITPLTNKTQVLCIYINHAQALDQLLVIAPLPDQALSINILSFPNSTNAINFSIFPQLLKINVSCRSNCW